jgi:hypothetical protein
MQKSSFFNPTGYMIAALFVIANAVAIGIEAIESNGVVGFILFGAGVLAMTYILAGVARGPAGWLRSFVIRRRGGLPRLVPGRVVIAAAASIVPAAAGASVFKNHGGAEEALNFVSFYTFAGIITWFAALVLITGVAWLCQESPSAYQRLEKAPIEVDG